MLSSTGSTPLAKGTRTSGAPLRWECRLPSLISNSEVGQASHVDPPLSPAGNVLVAGMVALPRHGSRPHIHHVRGRNCRIHRLRALFFAPLVATMEVDSRSDRVAHGDVACGEPRRGRGQAFDTVACMTTPPVDAAAS